MTNGQEEPPAIAGETPDGAPPPPGPGEPSGWRTVAGLTALASALGFAVFVVFYLAAEVFYAPFGLTPEDVGLDRTIILVRSSLTVGVMLLAGALAAGCFILAIRIGDPLLSEEELRTRPWPKRTWGQLKRRPGLIAAGTVGAIVVVFTAATFTDAVESRRDVRKGHRPPSGWTSPWRATEADVKWREGAPAELRRVKCVFVIGQKDGDPVVFARGLGSFRVPADTAIVVRHSDKRGC